MSDYNYESVITVVVVIFMIAFIALVLLMTASGAATGIADPQSWTGTISDSQCGINHEGELNEADCTKRCIELGFKYVLVSDGKILQIANQDFADLKPQAGKNVKLTGELKGDTITVSKIETQAKAK